MTTDELKAKYPTFTIRSNPLPSCRVCKGVGEYVSKSGRTNVCLCVCMDGDDETRALCVNGLQATVKKLKAEIK